MSNLSLDEARRALVRAVLREELRTLQATTDTVPTSAPPPTRDKFISTNEAAKIAGVRPETVRAWIQQGHLRNDRAGRLVLGRLGALRVNLFIGVCGSASRLQNHKEHRHSVVVVPTEPGGLLVGRTALSTRATENLVAGVP